MTTHDFVYQTFVIYIFIKSLILFPLLWVGFLFWRSERKKDTNVATTEAVSTREALLGDRLANTKPVMQ